MPIQCSDVLISALDEIGLALSAIRNNAYNGTNEERDELKRRYIELMEKYQTVAFGDIKALDANPRIVRNISELTKITQRTAVVRREMTDVKRAIDGAVKILGYCDKLINLVM